MQALLMKHSDPGLKAYFVWGPYVKTDNVGAAQQCSERYAAPNSTHLWTPTQLLSEKLASTLKLAAGRIAWDVFLLYKKGMVWDLEPPVPTYWQHQLEVIQGEPLNPLAFEGHLLATLRSPSSR